MGLGHPHPKVGVGEFEVAISGGVWVAIRVETGETSAMELLDKLMKVKLSKTQA